VSLWRTLPSEKLCRFRLRVRDDGRRVGVALGQDRRSDVAHLDLHNVFEDTVFSLELCHLQINEYETFWQPHRKRGEENTFAEPVFGDFQKKTFS
jgi:hypothetical protein